MKFNFKSNSYDLTVDLGSRIGSRLRGGEVFELVSDLGGGKTAFVRGLNSGFGSDNPVASPTFTINFVYSRDDGKQLHHYDFYRLDDAGIIAHELGEAIDDNGAVVVVEWGEVVQNVLPDSKLTLEIKRVGENERELEFTYPEEFKYLFEEIA
jgi:tRNA threonylcarbamoyladenosine biosynthesis protein TsaE